MGSRGSRWIVGAVGGYQGHLVGSRVTWLSKVSEAVSSQTG